MTTKKAKAEKEKVEEQTLENNASDGNLVKKIEDGDPFAEVKPFQVESQPVTLSDFRKIVFAAGITDETLANIEQMYISTAEFCKEVPKEKPIGIIGIGTDLLFTERYLGQSLSKFGMLPHVFLGGVENLEDAIDLILVDNAIADGFIVFPENVFAVSPFILADTQTLKTRGDIKSGCGISDQTIELSAKNGLKTRQISTDCPIYLEKDKVVYLLERFPGIEIDAVDFYSLYYNYFYADFSAIELDWRTDNITLPIVSENPKPEYIQKLLSGKKFVRLSEKSQSSAMQNLFSEIIKED